MYRFHFIFLAFSVLLAGCASQPGVHQDPVAMGGSAVSAGEQRQATLVEDVLVAEIAGQRGYLAASAKSYFHAAQMSRDPKVAERAVRIGLFAREDELALKAAELWNELEPNNSEISQILALLYLRNKAVDKAIPHWRNLLAGFSQRQDKGFLMVSKIMSQEENKAEAFTIMAALVKGHEKNPYAHLAYARMALLAEKIDLAQSALKKALQLKPGWNEVVILRANIFQSQGQYDNAIKTLRQALKQTPKDKELRFALARMLVAARRLKEAQKEYIALSRIQPKDGELAFTTGVVSLQIRHYSAAEKYLKRALSAGVREDESRYYLGQIAELEDRSETAVAWYRQVDEGEHYLKSRIRIAHILAESGEIDNALNLLSQLSSHNVQEQSRLRLAEGEIYIVAKRYEEAFERLTEGLSFTPGDPDLLYTRSLAAERLGKIKVAEADLRQIIKQQPDNVQALNALGYVLTLYTQHYKEALGYIQRALHQRPGDAAILDSMGWVLFHMKRYDEALGYLKQAYKLDKDGEIAAHLGEVLWAMGQQKEARELLQEALKQHPDNLPLRQVLERYQP